MAQQLEKPRVTEIQVRMDCNGCVQKIKKALHGINGIYDSYIDFPRQKLTIIGWADPEKIVKAIKKTRKTATICSHSEISDPPAQPPTEPAPDQPAEQTPAAPDATNPPQAEAEAATAPSPAEPPKDPPPPPPENPPSDATASASANNAPESQPAQAQPPKPKDVEEVHVIYYHPSDCGYRYSYGHSYGGHWSNYPNGPKLRQEPGIQQEPPPPVAVTQSYNTYKPSPNVTHSYNTYKPSPYVTEYEYTRPSPRYTHYNRAEHYSEDYHNNSSSNGNISSMFSDENPNACRIV